MGKPIFEYITLILVILLGVSWVHGDRVVILNLEQPLLGYYGWFTVLSFGGLLILKLILGIRREWCDC
jgi:hypothetical protein